MLGMEKMDIKILTWLAGLFLLSVSANTGLFGIITNDKIERPSRIAFYLNLSLSVIGAIFAVFIAGYYYIAVIFALYNSLSFLYITYIVKKRSIKALKFAEVLLATIKNIDLQICYILDVMYKKPRSDIGKPIRRTVRFILSELGNILGLDHVDHAQLCVLIPENNKFRVVAYHGIESIKVQKMEETFRHGPKPNSVAGHAMSERRTIIINDLSDNSNKDTRYWIDVLGDEKRDGSMLVHPIIRGIGSSTSKPIAVICVTSQRKKAFDAELSIQILNYFSPKIEILQNCWDIVRK